MVQALYKEVIGSFWRVREGITVVFPVEKPLQQKAGRSSGSRHSWESIYVIFVKMCQEAIAVPLEFVAVLRELAISECNGLK